MQLSQPRSIVTAVAAMSTALLGQSASAQSAKVESSILLYSETDRVKAAEAIANITKFLEGERTFSLKLTFDGLTGASPNGATPSRKIQTFTRPSGEGSYRVASGVTPLDDTFRDTRFAADGGFSTLVGRLSTLMLGAHFSNEHDYMSIGVNGGLTRDFNDKNTTVGVALSVSRDLVGAEGGAPVPFGSMQAAQEDGEDEEREGEEDEGDDDDGGPKESKNVVDAIVSLTQVLSRNTIARVNYSYGRSSGYLNDPYKLLSVVDGPTGIDPGEPLDYVYEKRPSTRSKNSVYGELRQYLAGHVLDLSYRYYWDDWQVKSHTVDFFYRMKITGNHALQPHLRWYRQSAADFHRYFLVSGQPLPAYASADYRLAKFDAYTVGLQYYLPIHEGWQVSLGGEYYIQRGDKSPPEAFGSLRNYDLFPDMTSIMLRLGIGHDF